MVPALRRIRGAEETGMRKARIISIITILTVAAAVAPPAARSGQPDSTAVEGTTVAADDSAGVTLIGWELWMDRLNPMARATIRGNESSVTLTNSMSASMNENGWVMNSSIDISKEKFRGRDMENMMENFLINATRIEPESYTLAMTVSDRYLKKKTFGLARFGKDIVFETEAASIDFSYLKPLLHARKSQLSIRGLASRGQNDFKYDRALDGGAGAYLWYGIGGAINVSGGYGTSRRSEGSDVGTISFNGIPSKVDTMRAKISLGQGDAKILSVSYNRTSGVIRKVDPPLGNSLEILDNPELAQEEETRKMSEVIAVQSKIEPTDYLAIGVEFNHDYSDQQNRVDTRLSRETESNNLELKADYTYCTGGNALFSFDRDETDNDYGPVSVASNLEKMNKASVRITHKISDSLSVSLFGAISLKQRFYKKKEANPRDADYLTHNLACKIAASPFPGIDTGVDLGFTRYETVNIDATISGDNRVDFLYRAEPTITITPFKWLRISQKYDVKIEYTEFTYVQEDNYLDRTTTLRTDADFTIFPTLTFRFGHSYIMKDTGSYLPSGKNKYYNRTDENVENRINMNLNYTPAVDLDLFVQADFRDQQKNRLGVEEGRRVVTSASEVESGGFKAGFRRNSKLTESGSLDLDIAWVRKFGPYLTPERREFWEVNANLTIYF